MASILVADDSPFVRLRLKKIISQIHGDYTVIESDSGESTLKQFQKNRPELVLLDIVMPTKEEEGIDALREIVKINPKAKVVMLTAVGYDKIVAECKKLGAVDYIQKPFDEEEIQGIIKKYV